MRLDQFTVKAQDAITSAQTDAEKRDHPGVTPEHPLRPLMSQEGGAVPAALGKMGLNTAAILQDVMRALDALPHTQGAATHLSPKLDAVLKQALREAEALKDEYLSTEHLLLALLDAKTLAGEILKKHGLERDDLLRVLKEIRGNQRVTDPNAEDRYQALEKYGRDLTERARTGKLDPVIGRDDELHTVVGAGAAEGSMDASNMLKPMLARGELRCIGATTLNEYQKHIEKDAALERRFQPVYVDEPTVEETIAILRGLKERYEVHHGVRIQDSAIIAAATLSHRYIADRFLPDKAIDLMDEAASRLRIEIDSLPVEIDEIERRIVQLEIERQALKKEKDKASRERLAKLEKELAELREKSSAMKAEWQKEKAALNKVKEIKEKIERTRFEAEQATRRGDLNKAAEAALRHPARPREGAAGRGSPPGREQGRQADAQGGGRRRGRGRDRLQVDGHPGVEDAGGRAGEAAPHRGPPARACRGPGRGADPRGQRRPAVA